MAPTLPSFPNLDLHIRTRDGLHRVAEHVVAKSRYDADGEIRLTATPGGFGVPVGVADRRVRVDGDELVVEEGGEQRSTRLRTIGSAAAFVPIKPGLPTQLYAPATTLETDAELTVDRTAALAIGEWYAFSAAVLDQVRDEVGDLDPSPLVLWPEHFDQAFFTQQSAEDQRANFGASPGDDGHPLPYLYVGPFADQGDDPFWNAAHFRGAVLSVEELGRATDPAVEALDFLRRGVALIGRREG